MVGKTTKQRKENPMKQTDHKYNGRSVASTNQAVLQRCVRFWVFLGELLF